MRKAWRTFLYKMRRIWEIWIDVYWNIIKKIFDMRYLIVFLFFMVVLGWIPFMFIHSKIPWGNYVQEWAGCIGTGILFGKTLARWNRGFWD